MWNNAIYIYYTYANLPCRFQISRINLDFGIFLSFISYRFGFIPHISFFISLFFFYFLFMKLSKNSIEFIRFLFDSINKSNKF